jgi:2-keto-4-pentenoate hydratase/2-oxohepta-3-ene-1,7-dioic acid hydratase in catechol pathway
MEEGTVRYVRFEQGGRRSWGILDGREIRELVGRPWEGDARTGAVLPLPAVKLVAPAEPTKVLALAGNYKSHLAGTTPFANPEVFYKPPSSLLEPEGTIIIPPGTSDVHYEGELVVVLGKRAKAVSPEEARACVFGVTCGNDVSARDWQKNDKQWWRAKGCDTFGPLGPWLVRGLAHGDLKLTTRLNGETKQEARTSELIFDIPTVVSFVSRHVTLLPGDLIFTGTPGTTTAMKAGDVVEVEIEGIGVLKNRVG